MVNGSGYKNRVHCLRALAYFSINIIFRSAFNCYQVATFTKLYVEHLNACGKYRSRKFYEEDKEKQEMGGNKENRYISCQITAYH